MSDGYKVPVTTIKEIKPHNNSDNLEFAVCYDFHVIVRKNTYKPGQKIIYVPIDSVLPKTLEEKLFPPDSKIKLNNGRIKQIKIRSLYSQGMLIDLEDVKDKIDLFDPELLETNVAEALGITKYEPPAPNFATPAQKRDKPKENPMFHKYNGVENIKWYPDLFTPDEDVVVQEKLHGCLRNFEEIQLTDGSKKTIQEIVDNEIKAEIWGYDEINKKIVATKITNWFNNGRTEEWLKVKFTKNRAGRGNHYRSLEVTPNHQFFLSEKNEYVNAEFLKPGDKVFFKRDDYELNYIQEQILIGKMLGDGYFDKESSSVTFGHKKEFESYIDYTLESLGDLAGNKQKDQISGYGTLMARARTRSCNEINALFWDWFITGKKEVPTSGLQKISAIALAFWYMDDGSLGHHEDQEDRVNFATCGFNEQSIDNLLLGLDKFGILGVKYQSSNYWRIRLNSDEAEKFFLLIAQYVPDCMKYKLPVRYRDFQTIKLPQYSTKYKNKLVEQEIISVEEISSEKKNLAKYDIETETHNFFVNGVLVHNSNCRAAILPFQANTFFKKIKKFLGLAPKFEHCYGSNNVQLQERKGYKGWYGENVYGKVLEKVKAFDKIKPNEIVYGELIGEGIQKNYHYGHKEHHFVLFDVKIQTPEGAKWLNPHEVEEFAHERGFDFVPVLYKGKFDKEKISNLVKQPSVYYPDHKTMEGVVIKSLNDYNSPVLSSSKKVLKLINEAYLDKDQSDYH